MQFLIPWCRPIYVLKGIVPPSVPERRRRESQCSLVWVTVISEARSEDEGDRRGLPDATGMRIDLQEREQPGYYLTATQGPVSKDARGATTKSREAL